MPAAPAVSLAFVICAAVGLCGARMSQPWGLTLLLRPSVRMACSVMTVFGAEVPAGSAPTSWITGFCTHWPGQLLPWSPPVTSCMPETPDSPGRAVRTSASGLTSAALIPNACSSWGVATYTGPDQDRPGPGWSRWPLLWSSSMTVLEPRALAMFWATAAWACGVLAVPGALPLGPLGPLGPLPGPPPPGPPLGAHMMSSLLARVGPA